MKKINLLLALTALASVSFLSCQKEADKTSEPSSKANLSTITAVTSDIDTKTYVDGLQVKWSAGDEVLVATSAGTATFELTAGENTANATFSGDLAGGTLSDYAVYPSTGLFGTGDDVYLNYQNSWDYGKAEVPMYGVNDGTGQYSFHNIGGAVQVTYTNIPVTTLGKFFKIMETHTSMEAKYITGTAWVYNLDSTPEYDLSLMDGQEVTINNIPKDATEVTLVIPIPAESGYSFQVGLYEVGNSTPIPGSVKNASNRTITANMITKFPTIAIPDAFIMFEERFTASTGNSTGFSGGAGSGTFEPDNDGWTIKEDKQYGAGSAAKFGTSSVIGEAETPSISIPAAYRNQPVSLHFKAAAWSGDGTSLTLTVTGATASETDITIGNASWTEHDVTLTSLSETISVKFTPTKRWFLDDVVVFFGPSLPSERALSGISYDEHSFNAATGGVFVTPTLNNPNGLSGITYSSSDSDIADVDENTGAVTIGTKTGTARITASFAGNATYRPGSDYYEIEVSDPINVTYWINGAKTVVAAAEGQALNTVLPANPDCGISGYEFAGWSESTVATTDTKPTYTSATEVPAIGIELWAVFVKVSETPVDASDITYNTSDFSSRGSSGSGSAFTHNEEGVAFYFSKAYESGTSHIKLYGGCDVSFTASRNITSVVVTFSGSAYTKLSGDNFTISNSTGTWSGTPAKTVNLSNTESSQARVTSIVVSLAAGTNKSYSGYTTSPTE